jgi:tRNA nucleotidyltransferase (CCA-adding enzyme)
MNKIPTFLLQICRAIKDGGGETYLVGGCVRDHFLDLPQGDYDCEVFKIGSDKLIEILSRFGSPNLVGMSFGVIKVRGAEGHTYDFSLARRDSKEGSGHKGFKVTCDPTLTPEEASARRDYTINSLMYEPLRGEYFDFHGGREAIERRVLHRTSTHFSEDPLRVLRGMQFAGRFNMQTTLETARDASEIRCEYATLPKERVFMEWYKWGAASKWPSAGIRFLMATDWLTLYPCLRQLVGLPQSSLHHPEGCAFTHTLLVCDAAAAIADREGIVGEDRVVFLLTALLHDVGKVQTTVFEKGDWRSPAHAEVGVPIAADFLKEIGCFPRITERVLPLIQEHMFAIWMPVTKRAARRLVKRLGPVSLRDLYLFMEADHSGRPPIPAGPPKGAEQLFQMIVEDVPQQATTFLKGRDLLALGLKPGVEMGLILKEVGEAQLDGHFDDKEGALEWVRAEYGISEI